MSFQLDLSTMFLQKVGQEMKMFEKRKFSPEHTGGRQVAHANGRRGRDASSWRGGRRGAACSKKCTWHAGVQKVMVMPTPPPWQ